jgi:hypothetical protein
MLPCIAFIGKAQAQGSCSPIDSTGYVLLHPYFEGKNWKKSVEDNIDIVLPDTLCSQKLRPVRFDIGKSIDSTLAVFSIANGGLFIIEAQYFHYAGVCRDELDFLAPQKVPLSGIAFSGTTPWYLVKDSAFNLDTVKVVLGVASQYCLVAAIIKSTAAVVRIDTLHVTNTNTISSINGGYDNVLMRDTCIWVTGNNGMLRHFSYRPGGWGAENKLDITATETVLCANATYAGTSSGRIYKKNASQTYVLDYSMSNKAINAIYPQGSIGNNGAFIENINGVWRNDTLGSGNYLYANFIKRAGGFGVELLDNQWKYSIFTYRDTASKILLTNPIDIGVSNVNKTPYIYNPGKVASPKDTTISVYISDPDSNFSDVAIALNGATMENDGKHSIGPIPDSESCHVGALRLTTGVLTITLKKDSVVLKTQTELGVENAGCLVCNWKNYNFAYSRQWFVNSSLLITAGKDRLTIANQSNPVTTIRSTNIANYANANNLKIIGNRLIFTPVRSDIKKIESVVLYDLAGRKLFSFSDVKQTSFELPKMLPFGIACISINYSDGSACRVMVPVLR